MLPHDEGMVGPCMRCFMQVAESKASSSCCVNMGQTYSIEYAQPQLVHVPQLYTCILDLTARPASRRSTTEANMLLPPPLPTGTYVRTHIIL